MSDPSSLEDVGNDLELGIDGRCMKVDVPLQGSSWKTEKVALALIKTCEGVTKDFLGFCQSITDNALSRYSMFLCTVSFAMYCFKDALFSTSSFLVYFKGNETNKDIYERMEKFGIPTAFIHDYVSISPCGQIPAGALPHKAMLEKLTLLFSAIMGKDPSLIRNNPWSLQIANQFLGPGMYLIL